ncbi:MAG TPA: hypothetical protein VFL98_01755 [Candidatus Paceibacterota bacterium]|nr:hypothetical protein [Candidatus Paceibacterota bacterium]
MQISTPTFPISLPRAVPRLTPRQLVAAGLGFVLIGTAVFAVAQIPRQDAAAGVRSTVEGFGYSLSSVPLLTSDKELARSMQEAYGIYVAPELIAAWQQDPAEAPGRLTSSPWPDHIAIGSISPNGDGTYSVSAAVIEKSEATKGSSIYASYPVELTVSDTDAGWRISAFTGYPAAPAPRPGSVVVSGTFGCLSAAATATGTGSSGTCTYGITDAAGRSYALADTDAPRDRFAQIPRGTAVTVTGTFAPRSIATDADMGMIDIASIALGTSTAAR